MKISIIYTVFLLANLFIVLASFPSYSSGEENINTPEAAFRVDGMSCSTCALSIRIALKKLDGVINAEVSYKEKVAKVKYVTGKVTINEMIKTIESTGNYKATPVDIHSKRISEQD